MNYIFAISTKTCVLLVYYCFLIEFTGPIFIESKGINPKFAKNKDKNKDKDQSLKWNRDRLNSLNQPGDPQNRLSILIIQRVIDIFFRLKLKLQCVKIVS